MPNMYAGAWNESHTQAAVFASEISLAPGEWPEKLWFDGRSYRLVEILRDREGDVTEAIYDDSKGAISDYGVQTVTVYND